MKNLRFRLAAMIAAALIPPLFSGCSGGRSTAAIPAVSGFDSSRYMGTWYEIARLPHIFERGMHQVSASYSPASDGTFRVINRGVRRGKLRSVSAVGRMRRNSGGRGELEVSFFRPFYGAYRIIRLDPEYRTAVVTSDTMDHLWILARTPVLPPEELAGLVSFAAAAGFDTSGLIFPDPAPLSSPQ